MKSMFTFEPLVWSFFEGNAKDIAVDCAMIVCPQKKEKEQFHQVGTLNLKNRRTNRQRAQLCLLKKLLHCKSNEERECCFLFRLYLKTAGCLIGRRKP